MKQKNSVACTKNCFLYMIKCGNGGIYTGVTTRPVIRMREHFDRKYYASRYTRIHKPVSILLMIEFPTKGVAMKQEKFIKRFLRNQKVSFIKQKGLKEPIRIEDFLARYEERSGGKYNFYEELI